MKLKVAPHISTLVPYPPGKPIEELEREYGVRGSIKLASNENAWGPSPKAVEAIKGALQNLHRYPDGSCYYLAQSLAGKIGVTPEEIVFGNGSNEIIGLLIAAFLEPGAEVVTSHPTFLMYQKLVQVQGGSNKVVELTATMHHDLKAILEAVSAKTRMIFLDNPNNPTGTIIDREDFASFMEQLPEEIIVVLDEAYVDFVAPEQRIDVLGYIKDGRAMAALRTFSKAYGLSGLRLGYGVMDAEMAGYLNRVRQPFNVNSLAQVGGLAALADEEHYRMTLHKSRDGIAWLSREVAKLGCRPMETHTNFFLIDVKGDGRKLYEHMLHQGVIVRPMQAYGYPNYIRITVGRSDENQRFVKALAKSLKELGYG
ncbi:MAG: histidinol-phosphate aminotransferase [Desulfobacterales bacterium SG8_35]|nr:MAG: histidinol-phosphate aminotransferase [Desulfobacterales bacterium SG8_35]